MSRFQTPSPISPIRIIVVIVFTIVGIFVYINTGYRKQIESAKANEQPLSQIEISNPDNKGGYPEADMEPHFPK